jgi:hypothetical protein
MDSRQLYDHDFFEWTRRNAALLRAGRFQDADILHIAEEIEHMGRSQQNELFSRLRTLTAHLLQWKYQPTHRGSSWIETINEQRDQIEDLLRMAPNLKNQMAAALEEIYPRAVRRASSETGLPRGTFPPSSPFGLDQILDEEFFPE